MRAPSRTDPKSALRREMRTLLRAMPTPPPGVCDRVAEWLDARPDARVVAIFAPLPGEPDLLPLAALPAGRRLCLPKVSGDHLMTFHEVADVPDGLCAGAFGILEPPPGAAEMPIGDIDAFLCPGLAFDRQGGRLGRGRGYYDRALAGARAGALKAGVCFSIQLVDSTFSEAHDARMDVVISELGMTTPSA